MMIGSREVSRSWLMAAAIGDMELVRKHLDADPECIRRITGSATTRAVHQRTKTLNRLD